MWLNSANSAHELHDANRAFTNLHVGDDVAQLNEGLQRRPFIQPQQNRKQKKPVVGNHPTLVWIVQSSGSGAMGCSLQMGWLWVRTPGSWQLFLLSCSSRAWVLLPASCRGTLGKISSHSCSDHKYLHVSSVEPKQLDAILGFSGGTFLPLVSKGGPL